MIGLSSATAILLAQKYSNELQFQSDSDRDGLSDSVEQALLNQFRPQFLIGEDDCSGRPAEFKRGTTVPQVEAVNGTIYGQVFSAKHVGISVPSAEIHYYLLWRMDCGSHGHALDTNMCQHFCRRRLAI